VRVNDDETNGKTIAENIELDEPLTTLRDACNRLATAAARIVEDDAHPTIEHMRELDRARRIAIHAMDQLLIPGTT
jgi:hypothetical protein